jgi:outer membrane lipoprotein-sorting protein
MSGLRFILASGLFCAGAVAWAATLDQALARMDQNATKFKSVTAKIRYDSYIAVVKEHEISAGTLRMRRSRRDVIALVDFTEPDAKSMAFAGTKLEIYYPKLKTVEVYNLGRHEFVEKYLALGFGASSNDLKTDYAITQLGVEPLNGAQASRLELIPKSKQVLQQVLKIELWMSDATGYPVQEKFYKTGGDYMIITYSDVTINPTLPDSAFKLTLPKGVQRVFPGK